MDPETLAAREEAAASGIPLKDPEGEGAPKKKKIGRPKKKPETAPEPGIDPEMEAEDTVQTVDEIQGFFSPALRFTDKEREFHKRSVFLVAKHYNVSVSEGLVLAHASASVLMIGGKWTRALWKWLQKPKEAREVKEAKPADIVGVRDGPPPPDAESVP